MDTTDLQLSKIPKQIWIPLQFWFNRDTKLAIPLVALQFWYGPNNPLNSPPTLTNISFNQLLTYPS